MCFGAANNQTLSYTANGFLVLSRQFVSDAAGNVTGDTDVGSGTTTTFIYNDPGQLSAVETGATPTGA